MSDQTKIYETVEAEFNKFSEQCRSVKTRRDCEPQVYGAIDDLLNGALDSLSDLEAIANRIDEQREYEAAHPEKEYDKYENDEA